MSNFLLKASHVQHLTDARYFAAWNACYLCIDVVPDMTEMEVFKFREIATWVEGPQMVGTFPSNFPTDKVAYFRDALQLAKIEWKGKLHELQDKDADIFHIILDRHTSIADIQTFIHIKSSAEIVLDFATNSVSVKSWDFSAFPNAFYYMDMDPETMIELILKYKLRIQLAGAEEVQVGVKQFDELDEILEGIEELIFE